MKKQISKIIISAVLFAIALFVDFSKIGAIQNIAAFDITIINKVIFVIAYLIVGFEVLKEAIEKHEMTASSYHYVLCCDNDEAGQKANSELAKFFIEKEIK